MLSGREISLGKILGIEITLDYSWFWIFLLITWSFAASIFPAVTPGRSIAYYIILGLVASLMFFISVILHEVTHTIVARRNNLPIEKITLFLFGGASRLTEEPPTAEVELKMAIAGPISSLVIGIILLGIARIFQPLNPPAAFRTLFSTIGGINIALGIFNLLPGFPLDGGRVFRAFVWRKNRNLLQATRTAVIGGQVVAGGLVIVGIIQLFTSNLGGLWLILIGYFLYQSARSSYEQTAAILMLRNLSVKEIMTRSLDTIDSDATLEEMARLSERRRENFLVKRGNKIIGLIGLEILSVIPRDKWNMRVGQVMTPLKKSAVVAPQEDSSKALNILSRDAVESIPVVNNNRVIGIIRLKDIISYLRFHPI